jgi:PAS domain S-box-containing protein
MAFSAPPGGSSQVGDRYFRSVLDRMLEGCQIVGPDWRYHYVNDAVLRQARRTRTDLIDRTMMEAFPGIETTPMFGVLRQAMQTRQPARMVNEFTHRDGSAGWFELSIQPIDEGLLIMSLDMTAHRQAEANLRRQVGRLDALRRIDLAILGTTDEPLALGTVAQEARAQLGMDGAVIVALDPETETLELAAHAGFGEAPAPSRPVRLGEGLLGRAALERRTIEAPALLPADHPGADEWFSAGAATRSAYATPLVARDRVLGVLGVDSRDAIRADRDWIAFFESLAGQAAMALDACRLGSQTQGRSSRRGAA